MKLALVTARTATLVTLFQTTQPLPWSAKEFEPMQWTRPTQKLFGRKAKRWSESRFNGCYVAREENHQKGSAGSEEKHNDETDETRRHLPLPGATNSLHRMGYGAMQLAGPGVWGPPQDVDAAITVLREALA